MNKEKYFEDRVKPIIEDLIFKVLKDRPSNPVIYFSNDKVRIHVRIYKKQ